MLFTLEYHQSIFPTEIVILAFLQIYNLVEVYRFKYILNISIHILTAFKFKELTQINSKYFM